MTGSGGSGAYGNTVTVSASGGSGTGAIQYQFVSGGTASGGSVNSTTGAVTSTSTGTVLFRARRLGDANYNDSAWSPNYTVTFNARPITVTRAGSKTFNGTTSPTGASASITSGSLAPGDSIGYSFGATSSANAGSYAIAVTPTITNAAAPTTRTGSYTVTYAGNFAITAAATTFTVNGPFTYNGTARSVTITPNPAAATFTPGGTTSATNAGAYTATATATGNYTGSNSNLQWTISKANQTIAFANPGAQLFGTPLTLNATATSGLPVAYQVGGPANLSGTTLTFTAPGTVTVTASQAGNANFNAAAAVQQAFLVGIDNGPDGDGDGVPDAVESLLGADPGEAAQADSANTTQLKVQRPQP